jgi:hypothetical protein
MWTERRVLICHVSCASRAGRVTDLGGPSHAPLVELLP